MLACPRRMPLRLGAPPRNYVAAIYRGGCPRDAGRALQEISARPLLWRESVDSFRKHLDVRWKELGFASARMAQRYAAAALGMTQVGWGTTRARPLPPPRPPARRVRFVISLFHPHSQTPNSSPHSSQFEGTDRKVDDTPLPTTEGQARVLNALRRRRALAFGRSCTSSGRRLQTRARYDVRTFTQLPGGWRPKQELPLRMSARRERSRCSCSEVRAVSHALISAGLVVVNGSAAWCCVGSRRRRRRGSCTTSCPRC